MIRISVHIWMFIQNLYGISELKANQQTEIMTCSLLGIVILPQALEGLAPVVFRIATIIITITPIAQGFQLVFGWQTKIKQIITQYSPWYLLSVLHTCKYSTWTFFIVGTRCRIITHTYPVAPNMPWAPSAFP